MKLPIWGRTGLGCWLVSVARAVVVLAVYVMFKGVDRICGGPKVVFP